MATFFQAAWRFVRWQVFVSVCRAEGQICWPVNFVAALNKFRFSLMDIKIAQELPMFSEHFQYVKCFLVSMLK